MDIRLLRFYLKVKYFTFIRRKRAGFRVYRTNYALQAAGRPESIHAIDVVRKSSWLLGVEDDPVRLLHFPRRAVTCVASAFGNLPLLVDT